MSEPIHQDIPIAGGIRTQLVEAGGGTCFGRATLDSPGALNALSLPMIDALDAALRQWRDDPRVAGVIIDSDLPKAFCAGGDIRALYHAIRAAGPGQVPREALDFFEREYRLDHLIHRFPKPVLCWGNGLVLGGGVGLLAGASHRVVTTDARLAMPEVSIGLYPDVGGSAWLARRRPLDGLFLALTGTQIGAGDALRVGLATHVLDAQARDDVYAAIAATTWRGGGGAGGGVGAGGAVAGGAGAGGGTVGGGGTGGGRTGGGVAGGGTGAGSVAGASAASGSGSDSGSDDHAWLDALLAERAATPPASELQRHQARIEALFADGDDLAHVAPKLAALADDADPWLSKAARTFAAGSPTSAALALELQKRARGLSLADVFRLEYQASSGCCAHADFAEGVRALLIDRDRSPSWSPATREHVDAAWIEDHLRPRFEGRHPLADLQD